MYSSNHPQNRWNMKFCCDKETDLRKLKVESVWSKQTPGFFGILTGFWSWKHSTLDVWMTCEVWFQSSFYPRILATPAKGTGAWSSSQKINGPKIGWTSACESSWVCRNHSDAFWCWVCHVSTTRISLRHRSLFKTTRPDLLQSYSCFQTPTELRGRTTNDYWWKKLQH